MWVYVCSMSTHTSSSSHRLLLCTVALLRLFDEFTTPTHHRQRDPLLSIIILLAYRVELHCIGLLHFQHSFVISNTSMVTYSSMITTRFSYYADIDRDVVYLICMTCLILAIITSLSKLFLSPERNKESSSYQDIMKISPESEGLFVACANTPFNCKMKRLLEEDIRDFNAPWWYSSHLGTVIPFGYGNCYSLSLSAPI